MTISDCLAPSAVMQSVHLLHQLYGAATGCIDLAQRIVEADTLELLTSQGSIEQFNPMGRFEHNAPHPLNGIALHGQKIHLSGCAQLSALTGSDPRPP